MEACSNERSKRLRDDSDANSPVSKIARVDSGINSSESQLTRVNSAEECVNSGGVKLVRVDSEDPILDSPVARDIQNDLLDILDDTDTIAERDTAMQGLDSVIKSFEEEILASDPDAAAPHPVPDSGELQLDLGYLLEASDDELGLPPSVTPSEEEKPGSEELNRVGSEGVDTGGLLGFENENATYGSVGSGSIEDDKSGGFVSFDGFFDYPEPYDVLWRSESLQAM